MAAEEVFALVGLPPMPALITNTLRLVLRVSARDNKNCSSCMMKEEAGSYQGTSGDQSQPQVLVIQDTGKIPLHHGKDRHGAATLAAAGQACWTGTFNLTLEGYLGNDILEGREHFE